MSYSPASAGLAMEPMVVEVEHWGKEQRKDEEEKKTVAHSKELTTLQDLPPNNLFSAMPAFFAEVGDGEIAARIMT
jgi:hypothetical protein